ncbi:MAG: cyclopropane-fatty-acyl-phospholipid synthase family protein [Pseudolabrys sp.]|nr:cyclopropane-fatty-acyl-phospholipid synthase family protein [Pseudolabrys sp.]
MFLLAGLLEKFIKNGTLRLYDASGKLHSFGGKLPGPSVTARIHKAGLETRLFLNPELRAGEAYMDGDLTFEDGSGVADLLMLFSVNRSTLKSHGSQKLLRKLWRGLRRWHQANPVGTAAKNARHHYDVSTELYRLFLDDQMQYSCAYFHDPENDTLEQAQRYKLIHATTKLQLKPGMTVCEIGSGWGGFAIHIARSTGARVVAINVSPEQIRAAREHAAAAGVSDLVEFREIDYRNLEGQFDRVVSVGMMEHVGIGHFDEYFGKVRDLLTDDGYAFIHCIGRMSPPGTTGPFIRKYIFPGAYVPAISEVSAALERNGLWNADTEILRLHYYYTIKHWRQRFAQNRDKAKAIYDERFCRMWEFYLAAVELEFLHGSHMVFQLLLARTREAVPIRRDFMIDAERHEIARLTN